MATKPIPKASYSQALQVPEAPNSYSVLVGQDGWQRVQGGELPSGVSRAELAGRGGRRRHIVAKASATGGLKFILTLAVCYTANVKSKPIAQKNRPLGSTFVMPFATQT